MKILFVSLGCDKNLVDTEQMLGELETAGYEFTDAQKEADVVIVNTCSFINDAKEESINTLLEFAKARTAGEIKALIATGCLAQRFSEEIRTQIKEVDAIVGTTGTEHIVACLQEVLSGESPTYLEDINKLPFQSQNRIITTGGHYAYLRIAEGCDKHCTYCIIPTLRGSFRSVPEEVIMEEAKRLVEQGVKELILVAQETTLYGVDLYGKKSLPVLLRKLCTIEGLIWIRILYCYPEEITQELIAVIKEEPKICHYLDIPIQHGSDVMLHLMGRKTNNASLRSIIQSLRKEIPDICLRTTIITGFPKETKKDHKIVCNFIKEMQFDRLGVFTYSPEEDTPAATFTGQIREERKEKQRNELMKIQQKIAFANAKKMIGRKLLVMIEGKVVDENAFVGRTYKDAPNVDGLIFIQAERELVSGEFVYAKVTGSYEYDLMGEVCDEFTK